jgi:hypothetical protein
LLKSFASNLNVRFSVESERSEATNFVHTSKPQGPWPPSG